MTTAAIELWEDVIDFSNEQQVLEVLQVAVDSVDEDWAWDDVRDKPIDVKKVQEARMEEINYMKSKGIWTEVDVSECRPKTGRSPVTVRWVYTNKGSEQQPIIRSRLVARDFKF